MLKMVLLLCLTLCASQVEARNWSQYTGYFNVNYQSVYQYYPDAPSGKPDPKQVVYLLDVFLDAHWVPPNFFPIGGLLDGKTILLTGSGPTYGSSYTSGFPGYNQTAFADFGTPDVVDTTYRLYHQAPHANNMAFDIELFCGDCAVLPLAEDVFGGALSTYWQLADAIADSVGHGYQKSVISLSESFPTGWPEELTELVDEAVKANIVVVQSQHSRNTMEPLINPIRDLYPNSTNAITVGYTDSGYLEGYDRGMTPAGWPDVLIDFLGVVPAPYYNQGTHSPDIGNISPGSSSEATAVVAGIVSKLREEFPCASADSIRQAIFDSALKNSPYNGQPTSQMAVKYGYVNPLGAIQVLEQKFSTGCVQWTTGASYLDYPAHLSFDSNPSLPAAFEEACFNAGGEVKPVAYASIPGVPTFVAWNSVLNDIGNRWWYFNPVVQPTYSNYKLLPQQQSGSATLFPEGTPSFSFATGAYTYLPTCLEPGSSTSLDANGFPAMYGIRPLGISLWIANEGAHIDPTTGYIYLDKGATYTYNPEPHPQ